MSPAHLQCHIDITTRSSMILIPNYSLGAYHGTNTIVASGIHTVTIRILYVICAVSPFPWL